MPEQSTATLNDMIAAVNDFDHVQDAFFQQGLKSRNPSIVWWAIKGCGLRRIEATIPDLLEILGTRSISLGPTDLRRIAALSLSQMGFSKLKHYLVDIHKNSNALLREGVADTLGLTNDPHAVGILDRLMYDENRSVLLWASLSLSKLGNVSVPFIKKHLLNAGDVVKALYLIDALKKINTPEARNVMAEYVANTPFGEVRDTCTNSESNTPLA